MTCLSCTLHARSGNIFLAKCTSQTRRTGVASFFPFGNKPKSITSATARKVCDCRQGTPRPVSAPAYFDELPAPAEAPDCVCIKASASRVIPRSRKINLLTFAFSGICSSSWTFAATSVRSNARRTASGTARRSLCICSNDTAGVPTCCCACSSWPCNSVMSPCAHVVNAACWTSMTSSESKGIGSCCFCFFGLGFRSTGAESLSDARFFRCPLFIGFLDLRRRLLVG